METKTINFHPELDEEEIRVYKKPDPKVAAACCISSCCLLPSGMFFFGLNVFEDRFPNRKLMSLQLNLILEAMVNQTILSDQSCVKELPLISQLVSRQQRVFGRQENYYSSSPFVLRYISFLFADTFSSASPTILRISSTSKM